MEKDKLKDIWLMQTNEDLILQPNDIIKKANKIRNRQYTSISIMSFTIIILIIYTFYHAFLEWNSFNSGLVLMISSLSLRILLEIYTVYYKEQKLISMTQKSYQAYLKKFYKNKLIINYVATPICVLTYIYGFYLLLPYFQAIFSYGFYIYIVFSGSLSITFIIGIIIYSIYREQKLLLQLEKK
ncbi:hypothetical protein ACFOUP_00475 [Belliella kenyensis]|uniref:DUF3278 domain-containing protein n=1 Tax=Belliella kenyensis TaxID=1472724 RepID=A0ABV8EHE9_9BACT|nr:hypothetical protein [Belliella kenyensis]MCH7401837.1 hypothetical protein [Belliella kenyensis]MDN3604337.1 hypothetical protein [Belliella kenyensis]